MTRPSEDLGPAAIERLLAGGPGESVGFTPLNPNPARMAEALVALANAHGGVIEGIEQNPASFPWLTG